MLISRDEFMCCQSGKNHHYQRSPVMMFFDFWQMHECRMGNAKFLHSANHTTNKIKPSHVKITGNSSISCKSSMIFSLSIWNNSVPCCAVWVKSSPANSWWPVQEIPKIKRLV